MATLKVLKNDLISYNIVRNCDYIAQCQHLGYGGFMKYEFMEDRPDILHTFYSVASLAITKNSTQISNI